MNKYRDTQVSTNKMRKPILVYCIDNQNNELN